MTLQFRPPTTVYIRKRQLERAARWVHEGRRRAGAQQPLSLTRAVAKPNSSPAGPPKVAPRADPAVPGLLFLGALYSIASPVPTPCSPYPVRSAGQLDCGMCSKTCAGTLLQPLSLFFFVPCAPRLQRG